MLGWKILTYLGRGGGGEDVNYIQSNLITTECKNWTRKKNDSFWIFWAAELQMKTNEPTDPIGGFYSKG